MKSLEELARIREDMKDKIGLRLGTNAIRVVVGMGTTGIANGAREVLRTLVDAVAEEGLSDRATVLQNGGVDDAELAPVVEVVEDGKDKVTYAKVTPEIARRIVVEHVKGGSPVAEHILNSK